MTLKSIQILVLLVCSHIASSDILNEDLGGQELVLPPLKGLSNLNQLESDAPSAITVISSDKLKKLGLHTIEEAMRLVPGVVVATATYDNPYIQYHGGNATKQRMGIRLNNHDYSIGQVHKNIWRQFDYADIKKISVSRSPGGANFGDRSLTAQINIDTFTPVDLKGASLKYTYGSRKTQEITAVASNNISNDALFSVGTTVHKSDGFDFEPDGSTKRWDYMDSKHLNSKFYYESDENLLNIYIGLTDSENGSSFANGSYSLPINNDPNDPLKSSKLDFFIDYQFSELERTLNVSFGHQRFKSIQNWDTCTPAFLFSPNLRKLSDINPSLSYALAFNEPFNDDSLTGDEKLLINQYRSELIQMGPTAFDNVCYTVSQKSKTERSTINANYEVAVFSNIRAIIGVNSHYETYDSAVFLNGKADSYGYNMYAQTEYKNENMTLNFGSSFESGKSLEGAVALRGSFNWHFDEHNTIRLAYSEGFRTPDILETNRDWRYKGNALNENPYGLNYLEFFYRNKNTANLKSERVKSYELSYLSNFDDMRIDNLVVFQHSISNSASNTITGFEAEMEFELDPVNLGVVYAYMDHNTGSKTEKVLNAKHVGSIYAITDLKIFQDDFDNLMDDNLVVFQHSISNSASNTITGFEAEMEFELDPVNLGVVYAYMDHNTGSKTEKVLNAKHVGSIYAITDLSNKNSIALAFYGNSDIATENYGRADIVYTQDFLSKSIITFQTRFSHFTNDAFTIDVIADAISRSYIQNKNEFFITTKIEF